MEKDNREMRSKVEELIEELEEVEIKLDKIQELNKKYNSLNLTKDDIKKSKLVLSTIYERIV